MDGESFKELLQRLLARHEQEVLELRRQLWELRENQESNEEVKAAIEEVTGPGQQRATVSSTRSLDSRESQGAITFIPSGLRGIYEDRPESSILLVKKCLKCEEPPRSGCLASILKSSWFRSCSMLMILANVVWMTWQTDWILQHVVSARGSRPPEFFIVEYAFTVYFLVEVLLGLLVHRLYFFTNGWNLLDFFIVAHSSLELAFSWANLTSGSVTYLRVLRVGSGARALRTFKVVTSFKDLGLMLNSFRACFSTMVWSFVVLLITLFICALVFAQGVVNGLESATESGSIDPGTEREVFQYFGSVWQTTLSLYMTMASGDDWSKFYNALADLGGIYHYIFLLYTFVFGLSIFNVLTGVFVDRAVAAAIPDREQQILEERRRLWQQKNKLREIFDCMDSDADGRISEQEFSMCMRDPDMVAYLSTANVSVRDARYFFRLLCEDDRHVDIDRFVHGCMAMKGSATALDMQKQLYHIKELEQILRRWEQRQPKPVPEDLGPHKTSL